MTTVRSAILLLKEAGVPVRVRVHSSWRAIADPLRRSRIRWFLLGWIIAVPALLLGGAFFIAGKHIIIAKGAYAIYARIPGGLHTHGAILLILGVTLVMGLSAPFFGHIEPRSWLRKILIVTGCYYGWSAVMFTLAPAVPGGQFSYVAVVTWTVLALLPVVLLVGPPPTLLPHDETELIRAAMQVGATPDQARELAELFFHAGEASASS